MGISEKLEIHSDELAWVQIPPEPQKVCKKKSTTAGGHLEVMIQVWPGPPSRNYKETI